MKSDMKFFVNIAIVVTELILLTRRMQMKTNKLLKTPTDLLRKIIIYKIWERTDKIQINDGDIWENKLHWKNSNES